MSDRNRRKVLVARYLPGSRTREEFLISLFFHGPSPCHLLTFVAEKKRQQLVELRGVAHLSVPTRHVTFPASSTLSLPRTLLISHQSRATNVALVETTMGHTSRHICHHPHSSNTSHHLRVRSARVTLTRANDVGVRSDHPRPLLPPPCQTLECGLRIFF